MNNNSATNKLLALACAVLLFILGLINFHAPLTVWLGSSYPEIALIIKSWKEILLLLIFPIVGYSMFRAGLLPALTKNVLIMLIAAYALLHIILLIIFQPSLFSAIAGLAIDLRYLLFFVLLFVVTSLLPNVRRNALRIITLSAVLVIIFSLLQIFVLPPDILAGIGYSNQTIAPYLTIDKNQDFVRINGTLRGPNPLGAYMLMVITLAGSYVLSRELRGRVKLSPKLLSAGGLLLAAPAVLYASYSRSAWLGTVVAAVIATVTLFGKRVRLRWWVASLVTALLLSVTGIYALKDTAFVATVIEHRDPQEPGQVNSNEDHLQSLTNGLERALFQPLGMGPGSTGSASLLGDEPYVVENQFLFVAHETGWLGLALFLVITIYVLRLLWGARDDWLSMGLFASGIGLVVVGLFLPVWADDTVSLVWWGLSAVVIGHHYPLRAVKSQWSRGMMKQD